jgi:TusA-related sulfurtransferase
MSTGWIKIHRSILDWEWYSDINAKVLFLHCLLMANREDRKYKGKIIKAGSFITGYVLLSEQTGLSVQQLRTALQKLKTSDVINITSNNLGTIINIVNYVKYQTNEKSTNQSTNQNSGYNIDNQSVMDDIYDEPTNQSTNDQQTNNKPSTTNKNIKNIKNIKNSSCVVYTERSENELKHIEELWLELDEIYPKDQYKAKAQDIFFNLEISQMDKVVASATELKQLFEKKYPSPTDREKLINYLPNLVKYIEDKRYMEKQHSIVPRGIELEKEKSKQTGLSNYQNTGKTTQELKDKFKNKVGLINN